MVTIPELWLPILVSAAVVTVAAGIVWTLLPHRTGGTAPQARPALASTLALHFGYALVISILVAYLTGRTVEPGEEYKAVFRAASTAAILAYAGSHAYGAIWGTRSWASAWRGMVDGVVYGLLTGGPFGSFWPGG